MAKKRRKRIWYFPFFASNKKKIELQKRVGDTANGQPPMLFDDPNTAYGFLAARRFDMQKDENGETIVNEDGYGQLKDEGKVHLIAFKGEEINWKNTDVLKEFSDDKTEGIIVFEDLQVNKQTVKGVFEESDEMYNQFARSPLAQAGGVKPIENSDVSTEDNLVTT